MQDHSTNCKKKGNFSWSQEPQEVFDQLKQKMISAPVLSLTDFSKTFIVETDASGGGIGAVLMQDGYPLAFISKALSNRKLTLSTYEKELLAIFFCYQALAELLDEWALHHQDRPY